MATGEWIVLANSIARKQPPHRLVCPLPLAIHALTKKKRKAPHVLYPLLAHSVYLLIFLCRHFDPGCAARHAPLLSSSLLRKVSTHKKPQSIIRVSELCCEACIACRISSPPPHNHNPHPHFNMTCAVLPRRVCCPQLCAMRLI